MLDNDELIATRKLNGIDDGLYKETSDKNVVTEEDLEELNEVLLHHRETEQVRIAIKHILSELKQKDKRIKELERENVSKQKAYDDCYCEYKHYKQFESIQEQKIKEALEDIEDYFDRLNGPDEDIEYIRQVKRELLEGERK